MNKQSKNYTKLAIFQFIYQSSISSSIDYFETDQRSIITLFQGEVKYLNVTNYHFSSALDLFSSVKHTIIIFMLSQSV